MISTDNPNNFPFENKEVFLSYRQWIRCYENRNIDEHIGPFLNSKISTDQPFQSWMKTLRHGYFYSTDTIAKKLGISRSAYCRLEKSEKLGTVNISTLRKVAAVMDCELVYGFRPTDGRPVSETIWEKLVQHLEELKRNAPSSIKTKRFLRVNNSRAMAAAVRDLMNAPEARRELGWTERNTL